MKKKLYFILIFISFPFILFGNEWIITNTMFTNGVFTNVIFTNGNCKLGTNLSKAWWDRDYFFRKKIKVVSSVKASNYQIFFSDERLGLASLLAVGHIQNGYKDIRFIDENNNVLPYWRCNYKGTNGFWVRTVFITKGTNIVYMYYGNSSANFLFNANVDSCTNYSLTMQKVLDSTNTNCIGLWHFDEGSGTIISDDSGKGNNATLVSGVWNGRDGGIWRDLEISFTNGDSIIFDGSSTVVNIPDDSSLDGMSACSIEFWFKANSLPPSGSYMTLVSKRTSGGPFAYHRISIDNGTGVLQLSYLEATNKTTSRPSLNVSTNLEIGKWYYVCGTFDGAAGEMKLYLNGNLIGSKSVWGQITRTISDFTIGANGTAGQYFDGIIDEVAIYRRALSKEEVISHYERRKYINVLPVVVYVENEESLPIFGIYYSSFFHADTVFSVKFNNIYWSGATNGIKFQIATTDDTNFYSFVGPDGTFSSFYTNNGDLIYYSGRNKYLKIKVLFSPYYPTVIYPEINSIKVTYTTNLPSISVSFPPSSKIELLGDKIYLKVKIDDYAEISDLAVVYNVPSCSDWKTNYMTQIDTGIFLTYISQEFTKICGKIEYYFIYKIPPKTNIVKDPFNSPLTLTLTNEVEYKDISFGTYYLSDGNIDDGDVSIYIPQGALGSSINLKIEQNDNNIESAVQNLSINSVVNNGHPVAVYSIKPFNILLKSPATLSLLYFDIDNNGIIDNTNCEEKKLMIYYYEGGKWKLVGGEIDVVNNILTVKIMKFGKYAIFASSGKLEDAYPEQKFITPTTPIIFGMTVEKVIIYDVNGKKIRELFKSDFQGSVITWNGRDENANIVNSGVYIYKLFNKEGKTKCGMIIMAK